LAYLGLFVDPEKAGTYVANPLVLEFLAGMLLAKYVRYVRRVPIAVAAAALILGLLGDLFINAEATPWRALLWGFPSALAVFGAVGLESRVRHFRGRRWRLLGDASYSLYLVHMFTLPAVVMVAAKIGGPGGWTLVVLSVLISIAASVASYMWFEKPLGRRLKKW